MTAIEGTPPTVIGVGYGVRPWSGVAFEAVGRVTALQAFEMLLKASQSTNMKLVSVAQWVADDHESGLNPV